MKKYIFAVLFSTFLYSCSPGGAREYRYSGTIVSHGYEGPTSGYKSSSDAKYYVMMRVDSSNQTIRVDVTVPTYYKLKDGDRASFDLSNWDLYYSGNTNDMTKNLYGQ